MTKEIPSYLRLHTEDTAPRTKASPDVDRGLQQFLDAFEDVTGWRLDLNADAPPADGEEAWTNWSAAIAEAPQVHLLPGLDPTRTADTTLELHQARHLGEAFVQVVHELQRTRRELWQREAELAAGVPVTARRDEEQHLAVRLEAILKGGAEAVQGCAAALYLLDDATTQLKMRACWGMPQQQLLQPARPLRGAVADLEALMGHAVVLEDTSLLPHWRVPEAYPAAVCVPVSSPTEPLGTLWIFAEQVRDFNSQQTNLVEIIAGRIAAELQREVLLQDSTTAPKLNRQLTRATQWQKNRLPNVQPLLDNWDLAGRRELVEPLAGSFYDWLVPRDGSFTVAVGRAEGSLLEAALTAGSLQSLLRACAANTGISDKALAAVSESFWACSAGGQFASLSIANFDPETGHLTCSLAGDVEAFILGPDRLARIPSVVPPLGTDPELVPPRWTGYVQPGECFVAVANVSEPRAATNELPAYVPLLQGELERSAEELLRLLAAEHSAPSLEGKEWSAVIARRI